MCRLLQRLTDHHDALCLVGYACNVLPAALNEQNVALAQLQVGEVVGYVVAAALHAQHVHVVHASHARVFYRLAAEARRVHQHHLRNADVVDGEVLRRSSVQFQVLSQTRRRLLVAAYIYNVARRQHRVRTRQLLLHILHEARVRLLYASHFEHGQTVAVVNVQFSQRLVRRQRSALHGEHREVVRQLIFLHQLAQRLSSALLSALLLLVAREEALAQRQQYHDAHDDADNAHGQKAEELERFVARLGQRFLNNKVGRRTDEREHTAHAACEGERHKQTARLYAALLRQTHHDRHHQRHRARVAYERSDDSRHHHQQQK